MIETLRKYRQDLHQIPELGFDLFQTHEYVRNELVRLGYEPITVAHTGIIAIKEGLSKDAIAFRSDMDALPVSEMNEISFASKHPGKMHACGHDGHMAMLLTFASYVASLKELSHSVVFLFQPAEEGPGGAEVIIQEGWFEKLNIKEIYGLHLFPGIDEGKIGLVDGFMTAQNGEFDITIEGTSSHGAQPHLGSDAIIAASDLIKSYQTIVSRNVNPIDSAVITVGTISGGEARNIIANQVNISGTIRAFKPSTYQMIKDKIDLINQGVELYTSTKIDCVIRDYYPAVNNPHSLFEKVKASLDENKVILYEPLMIAEDFAFYQQLVPGLFAYIGTRNEKDGFIHALHNNRFNFNEEALLQGLYFYQSVLHLYDQI